MNIYNEKAVQRLYEAIIKIQTEEECKLFFEDLCSKVELSTFAQRLEVAQKLLKGCSYLEVNESTGASTATISRIGKCINYGDGGYKLIIDRLEKSK